VPHATIGEERPHRCWSVVGRAVVDDEQLPVGERLREHRLDRFRQEPGVVLRGHHDGDSGRHTLIASRCSRATFEMQKRYFPLGSCGMESTSSMSYRTEGPNISPSSSPILTRLSGPKSVSGTRRIRSSVSDSCTICTCAVPGMSSAKFSVSEMP